MRENVKSGPFIAKHQAEADASWNNMGSDTNSFHVVEQRV
jgi:hypothetical protein